MPGARCAIKARAITPIASFEHMQRSMLHFLAPGRDLCRLWDGTVHGYCWSDYTPAAYSTLSSTLATVAQTSATATPGLASLQNTASASRAVAVVRAMVVAGILLGARC